MRAFFRLVAAHRSWVAGGLLLCSLCGCGSDDDAATLREIRDARMQVSALFLTVKTGREVIATEDDEAAVICPNTGEIAFRAFICKNPDCPGAGVGDRPFLFIWEDPLYYIDDEGELQFDWSRDRETATLEEGGTLEPECPACLKIRKKGEETSDQQAQYHSWCQPYVLPEAAAQMERLADEERSRRASIERRRAREVEH